MDIHPRSQPHGPLVPLAGCQEPEETTESDEHATFVVADKFTGEVSSAALQQAQPCPSSYC
jgi:hypothetical protein